VSTITQQHDMVKKTFDTLLKEKLNKSKNNNRKHSNKRFYMLFLSYKIMKKIFLKPNITERELKLVNSNFSRILLSILEKEELVHIKKGHKNVYELTVEGIVYLDFIESFLTKLGYKSYGESELIDIDSDE
jgi:hypothetical protein